MLRGRSLAVACVAQPSYVVWSVSGDSRGNSVGIGVSRRGVIGNTCEPVPCLLGNMRVSKLVFLLLSFLVILFIAPLSK